MINKFNLSEKSKAKLIGVHPDLVSVVDLAIKNTNVDFCVIEGLRTLERQKMLVSTGKSQTLNSRHLTGHAVDLGAIMLGKISWEWNHYEEIARAMKLSSIELKIAIEWGGDWETLKDGVHFQLPFKEYPVEV